MKTALQDAVHPTLRYFPTGPRILSSPPPPDVVEFEFEATGGMAFGGAADLAGALLEGHEASGGMAFGGTDQSEHGSIVGSGGMAFAGAATLAGGSLGFEASGGMAFGGHARGGKGGTAAKVDCGPTLLGEECDV